MCGDRFFGSTKCCDEGCAAAAVQDCIKQLQEKKGPIYDKWKSRIKASIEHI